MLAVSALVVVLLGDIGQTASAFATLLGIVINFAISFLGNAQATGVAASFAPRRPVAFADAVGRGFKGGLTMFGIMILALIAGVVVPTVLSFVWLIIVLMGSIASTIGGLAVLAGLVYVSCRLLVLLPVIAVDKEFNPISALKRSWSLTRGHIASLLVVSLLLIVLAVVVIGVPFGVIAVTLVGPADEFAGGLEGFGDLLNAVALSVLSALPFVFAFQFIATALVVAVHARISDRSAEDVAQIFE